MPRERAQTGKRLVVEGGVYCWWWWWWWQQTQLALTCPARCAVVHIKRGSATAVSFAPKFVWSCHRSHLFYSKYILCCTICCCTWCRLSPERAQVVVYFHKFFFFLVEIKNALPLHLPQEKRIRYSMRARALCSRTGTLSVPQFLMSPHATATCLCHTKFTRSTNARIIHGFCVASSCTFVAKY